MAEEKSFDELFGEAFENDDFGQAEDHEFKQVEEEQPEQTDVEEVEKTDQQQEGHEQTPEENIWKNASDEQIKAYQAAVNAARERNQAAQSWEHRYRSDSGRFQAAQRLLRENAQRSKEQPQPTQKDTALRGEKWDAFQKDMPEWGSAIAEAIRNETERIRNEIRQELDPKLKDYDNAIENGTRERAVAELSREHPDAFEITNSQAFRQWQSRQPAHIQDIIENSRDPVQASYVLSSFKRDVDAWRASQRIAELETELSKIKSGTNSRTLLEQSRTTRGKSGDQPKTTMPGKEDFEAAWDFFE